MDSTASGHAARRIVLGRARAPSRENELEAAFSPRAPEEGIAARRRFLAIAAVGAAQPPVLALASLPADLRAVLGLRTAHGLEAAAEPAQALHCVRPEEPAQGGAMPAAVPPGHAGDESLNKLGTTLLLQRIRSGDLPAQEELMRRLLPKIEQWVRSERRSAPLKDKQETMDLTQDVACELVCYLPHIQLSDSSSLERLLYRMVQNTLRDAYDYLTRLRRRASRERPLPADTILDLDPPHQRVETPSEAVGKREERVQQEAWLRLALPLLEPEDQGLILRHKMFGEPYVALAESLGQSADAVRMRCNRAVTRLVRIVGLLRRGQVDAALAAEAGAEA